VLVAGLEGGSRTASPGVRTSSSSVMSLFRRGAGGVSLGLSRTCCNEVLGSARAGDEGWSEFAIVESGDATSVIMRRPVSLWQYSRCHVIGGNSSEWFRGGNGFGQHEGEVSPLVMLRTV
jgi:hypothetical protein